MNLQDILKAIQPLDQNWLKKAEERTSRLVMPPRALGRLHDISERLSAIQKTLEPRLESKAVLVMAGDHGVVDEGVSPFPQTVSGEMIKTFLMGGAGINTLAGQVGAKVYVVDMGVVPELDPETLPNNDLLWVRKVDRGTKNMALGPAMTSAQAEKAVLTGFQLASDLIKNGVQILGTGDMGIGNTTPSAAIGCVFTGQKIDFMVGRGTGLDDEGLVRKRKAIEKALETNAPDPKDGLDVLMKIGGFEIGGIAGVILAGAFHQCPVVIDGVISTAGALIAHALCPTVSEYLFAGHCSEEPSHKYMLEMLGLKPILDLGMRLGEGTGGALAMGIMDGAVNMFRHMLTFDQAGVSEAS